ncbi:hypothetical protein HDV01_004047 [Terramyces sp. JEL0728]|nr:hypothetical protein HDV01_004047 [Terramyces sp. JEL0728]
MDFDLEAIEIQDPELAAWLPLATHGLIKVTDQESNLINRIRKHLNREVEAEFNMSASEEHKYSKQEIAELEHRLELLQHQQQTIKTKQQERETLNNQIMEFNESKTVDLEPMLIKINNKIKESRIHFDLSKKQIQDKVILEYIKAKAWNYYFGGSFCQDKEAIDRDLSQVETIQMQSEIRGLFNEISFVVANMVDSETDAKLNQIQDQLLLAKHKLAQNNELLVKLNLVKSMMEEKNEYPQTTYKVEDSETLRTVHSELHHLSNDLQNRLDEYYRFSKTRHYENEPPQVKQMFGEIKNELHAIQLRQKQ